MSYVFLSNFLVLDIKTNFPINFLSCYSIWCSSGHNLTWQICSNMFHSLDIIGFSYIKVPCVEWWIYVSDTKFIAFGYTMFNKNSFRHLLRAKKHQIRDLILLCEITAKMINIHMVSRKFCVTHKRKTFFSYQNVNTHKTLFQITVTHMDYLSNANI